MPRFSVVVPTRNRPDLLDFCLESLAAQTFDDLEVIVSDNATTAPARAVFARWSSPRWRYVTPERPLAMHDNFELSCAEATGEFVAILIDKTVLHPSALEVADRELRTASDPDIVTWWTDGYTPADERRGLARGRFVPTASLASPATYDPRAELRRRFRNAERRGADGAHYFRGKIVFGAYSRRLLDRIQEETGRVFYPLAPDYTSMVPACVLAESALDVGRPLLLSFNSFTSNGRRQSLDPAHARRFIEDVDPAIIDALPIAGLYTSPHNVVAYDLVSSAARCRPGTTESLDLANLVRRAREDLELVEWSDAGERKAQYAILEDAEQRFGATRGHAIAARKGTSRQAVAGVLARFPRVEGLAYRAAGRRSPRYPTPIEAARAADRHYAAESRAAS
jgi:cellulose synthase/poly-beta-1,6-N-acetylglucosamine synthase-like glycosyltransferase